MAKLEKIEFIKIPNARIIGREVSHSIAEGAENPVPDLWGRSFGDGTIDMLKKLPLAMPGYTIGWMGEFDGQNFNYIAGVIAAENASVPEGMSYRDLTACDVAKGYIYGNLQNGDVYVNAHGLTVSGISNSGFVVDNSFGWSAEVYPDDLDFDEAEGVICYFCPYKKG